MTIYVTLSDQNSVTKFRDEIQVGLLNSKIDFQSLVIEEIWMISSKTSSSIKDSY